MCCPRPQPQERHVVLPLLRVLLLTMLELVPEQAHDGTSELRVLLALVGALRPSAFGIPCFCDHGRGSAFPVDSGRANTSPNAYTAPKHPRSPSSGPILAAR
jgi:hypothetical protein